ncbi:LPXTG cell wall anchor domain-containing protein [Staphylococcus epidermidis]
MQKINYLMQEQADHDSKGTLLGTLFAGLGALLLGRRRKKDNKEK